MHQYVIPIAILIGLTTRIARQFVVRELLSAGKMKEEYRNKEVFKAITDRYKDSIDDVNRKIGFTITFAVIAVYVYFVLPATESVKIPLVELSVSREIWISVAPGISYGLVLMVFASFLWFMVLRVGIKIFVDESKFEVPKDRLSQESKLVEGEVSKEAFADLRNILLKGILGDLWMIFGIRKVFNSRWNYIWYIPLFCLVLSVVLSPAIISLFFTYQLFVIKSLSLGVIYTVLFFPVLVLLLILMRMIGVLGISERI